MTTSRRSFLRTVSTSALGFQTLKLATQQTAFAQAPAVGYGPLVQDPNRLLDLPAGFRYTAFSRVGQRMSDGFAVPALHDGMACFRYGDDPDRVALVRNHEDGEGNPDQGPFLSNAALFRNIPAERIYDAGRGTRPALGGTTNLIYNIKTQTLEKDYLTLVGTIRNCAGGPTPWNSWITCEETNLKIGSNATLEKDHGYNFEVPVDAEGLIQPVPLKAMGRMSHEAVAVDGNTWIVYQTEDRGDSLFYRFLPSSPGDLSAGGRLQALALRGRRQYDTRNPATASSPMPVGEVFDTEWMDIENPESPNDDLRIQGWNKGCARFARGEGAWASREAIWFISTSGGRAGKGQIFRYVPSPYEGQRWESRYPGKLELFAEPNDASVLDNPDNMCVSPWGGLFIVEDGPGPNGIVGATLDGELYTFGVNRASSGEMCGVCFSPDGSTMFVNTQSPGITFAITGPWKSQV